MGVPLGKRGYEGRLRTWRRNPLQNLGAIIFDKPSHIAGPQRRTTNVRYWRKADIPLSRLHWVISSC